MTPFPEQLQSLVPDSCPSMLCISWGLVLMLLMTLATVSIVSSKKAKVTIASPSSKRTRLANVPIDSVLYNPSRPLESCDDEYDVIVIGSGIGGLTTAALLAKRGNKVLVLEQHKRCCGGCCHTFESGGYRFTTGIHFVGGLDDTDMGSLFKSIMATVACKNDPIMWDRLPDQYDTVILGGPSDFRKYGLVMGGWETAKQNLKRQFPEEHAAIDEYYNLVKEVMASWKSAQILKALPLFLLRVITRTGLHKYFAKDYVKFSTISAAEIVCSLTENKDLQAVLLHDSGTYSSDPRHAPFFIHAFVTNHYINGSYYPRGGPDAIAKKIIPTITSACGDVLANAPVKQVKINKLTGRAMGVLMKNDRFIAARKAVVSDAGLYNTLHHLLDSKLKARIKLMDRYFGSQPRNFSAKHADDDAADTSTKKLHTSQTGMYLFIGLKGDHNKDLHLPHKQIWFIPSNQTTFNALERMTLDEALKLKPTDIPFLLTIPSGKDSKWNDKYRDKSTIEIMTLAPYKWFEKFAPSYVGSTELGGLADPGGIPDSHGTEYEAVKKHFAQLLWSSAVELLKCCAPAVNVPKSLDGVDHYQMATPLTFAHYYRRDGGAWYGVDNDLTRWDPVHQLENVRPAIPEIPRLYLTGQDACSNGFVGAMIGGWMCASSIDGAFDPMSILEKATFDPCEETSALGSVG